MSAMTSWTMLVGRLFLVGLLPMPVERAVDGFERIIAARRPMVVSMPMRISANGMRHSNEGNYIHPEIHDSFSLSFIGDSP
jgi:hypothetical protein